MEASRGIADVLPHEVWVTIFSCMANDDDRLAAGLASVHFRSFALASLRAVRLKGVRCHGKEACKNALQLLDEVGMKEFYPNNYTNLYLAEMYGITNPKLSWVKRVER